MKNMNPNPALPLLRRVQVTSILFLLLFSFSLFAQNADNYQFSTNTNASLVDMSSGTRTLITENQSLISSPATPIGFGFWFMGCYFTDFTVNVNGILRFGNTAIVARGNTYAIAGGNQRIAVFSTLDSDPNNNNEPGAAWRTSSTGKVHYKVIGSAPNRILVVEWLNLSLIVDFKNPNYRGVDATFQLLIHESESTSQNSGKIEFRYGQMKTNVTLNNAIAGFGDGEGATQSKGVDLSKNPPVSRAQAGAITSRIDSAATIPVLHQTAPNNSRTFIFDPIVPDQIVTNLQLCQLTPTSIQMIWQKANASSSAATTYYAIYRSTDGKNYQYLTRLKVPALTYTDENLTTGTTYHYQVYAVAEGKLSPLQSTGAGNWALREKLTFDIGTNKKICLGQTVTLSAPENLQNYRWNTGDSTRTITVSPTKKSTYKATATLGQCRFESNELEIDVDPPYIISIPPIYYVCKDQTTVLEGLKDYKAYEWYKMENNTKRVLGTSQSLTTGELGEVILKVTNDIGCTSTDTTRILAIPSPVFQIIGRLSLCEKDLYAEIVAAVDATQMTAGDSVTYVWRDSKNDIVGRSANYQAKALGEYQVTVTNRAGCAVSQTARITNCCEAKILVPNAFTPHGTPANNLYRTENQDLLNFKMSIFNRWGHLMFATTDPKEGWDGKYQGQPMPMDSYQVIITYMTCKDGKYEKKTITEVLHLLE